jgi:ribosomal protein S18 acetylase RimI-like enzyme
MVNIFNINEKMSLLEQVINLGDANKATLGFLQRGAFNSIANEGRILVAVDKNDNLLGYLLYGIKHSANLVYIVHLCVNQSERRQGIAKALFNELKETTKYPFSGIRVHCRRDYEVNKLWPRLGFVAVGEKDGRSKEGSKLTIWWFDYEHPSLFTFADEQYPTSRLRVAIDANLFIDLQEPPTSSNEETGKQFNIQSPRLIPSERFFRIYNMGMKSQ